MGDDDPLVALLSQYEVAAKQRFFNMLTLIYPGRRCVFKVLCRKLLTGLLIKKHRLMLRAPNWSV